MPNEWATPRASATACGPQHLSSAREIQSCGQTFMVTPTTSYPCSRNKYPATLESTPPLMPSKTRCLFRFIRGKESRLVTARVNQVDRLLRSQCHGVAQALENRGRSRGLNAFRTPLPPTVSRPCLGTDCLAK